MLPFLAAVLVVGLSTCNAGDPCPPKNELGDCNCTYLQLTVVKNGTTLFESTELQKMGRWNSMMIPAKTTPVQQGGNKTAISQRPHDFDDPQSLESFNTTYTMVECKMLKSLGTLKDTTTNNLKRKLIDEMKFYDVPFEKEHKSTKLPREFLNTLRVTKIQILNSKLSGNFIMNGRPFEGQSYSLGWLAARNCSLSGLLTYDTPGTVNTKGLRDILFLEVLDFSNNNLEVIDESAFKDPPKNLSTVILANNSINIIEDSAFRHLKSLAYIDLSSNLLESLSRNIFPKPAPYLRYIDISRNYLTVLSNDFFTEMPELETVIVTHNFLYTVSEKPWSLVWRQLKHIDFTGNFIKCDGKLRWLQQMQSRQANSTNSTSITKPIPLPEQTVLGNCSWRSFPFPPFKQYHHLAIYYRLDKLTKESIN